MLLQRVRIAMAIQKSIRNLVALFLSNRNDRHFLSDSSIIQLTSTF